MKERNMATFLKELRSQGRYSFTFSEAAESLKKPKEALRRILGRLKNKGEINRVHADFFYYHAPRI